MKRIKESFMQEVLDEKCQYFLHFLCENDKIQVSKTFVLEDIDIYKMGFYYDDILLCLIKRA